MSTYTKEKTEVNYRKALKRVCHMAYKKSLIAGFDGNLSLKIDNDKFLFTPSNSHKGLLEEEDFVLVNNAGEIIEETDKRPSSDLHIHLEAYKKRPDIGAFIHAHPQTVVALTLCGVDFNQPAIPNVIVSLGEVQSVKYTSPEREIELKQTINCLEKSNIVILEKHGAVTIGKDIFDAFYKMELLEHASKVIFYASSIGELKHLEPELVDLLVKERHRIYGKEVELREGIKLFQSSKNTFNLKNIFKKAFSGNSPVFQRMLSLSNELILNTLSHTDYSKKLTKEEKENLAKELTASFFDLLLGRFVKK